MLKRLPSLPSILQVYAVVAVMLSGWTITAFLWKLSAWLLILNIGEILTVFAYSLVANLVESLIVLSLLLAACLLLPPAFFRDDFVVRGTISAIGLIGSLMAFVKSQMQFGMDSGNKLLMAPLAVWLLAGVVLSVPPQFRFMRFLRTVILWACDRIVIFLYILLPLYFVFLIYIIFRNIV